MKKMMLVLLAVVMCSPVSFAADKDSENKTSGAKTQIQIGSIQGKQVDPAALAKAGEEARLRAQIAYKGPATQATTPSEPAHPDADPTRNLPDVPNRARCQNWNYEGENVRPLSGGPTGYQCPAGYKCHKNGILVECRWSGQPHEAPSIDNYFCRVESC